MPLGVFHGKGGAAEIVLDDETGILFSDQTEAGMVEAVLRFESMKLNSKAASENAARFSSHRFREEFMAHISSYR